MMKIKSILIYAIILSGFLFLVSCATSSHLHLTYRLPVEENIMAGKKIFVFTTDIRKDKRTFGKGARQKFEKTSENMILSIATGAKTGAKKGIFHPSGLLKEALESRLRHYGAEIVPKGMTSIEISLLLKSFLLDRMDRKWLVTVGYEARLMKDGKRLSSEIISGEAERFELVGKEQAEVILGEIFSDVVNQLDLRKFFQKIK